MRFCLTILCVSFLSGCIVEADRDLADLSHRAAQEMYSGGTEAKSEVSEVALVTTGQLLQRLGQPTSIEPLSLPAAQAAVTGSQAQAVRESWLADITAKGAAAGATALGLPALAAMILLARSKRRALSDAADAVVDVVDGVKGLLKSADISKPQESLARIVAEAGPLAQKVSEVYGLGQEVMSAYIAKRTEAS